MEQRKLPNTVASIVLGILGFLCCCLFGAGLIPAGIALFLAKKAEKLNTENPELYDNYGQVKTAKIIAIIAIIVNVIWIIRIIYVISTIGWDQMIEESRQMQEQWGLPTS